MGFDKLSFDLGGETVLERSVRAFDECPEVDELVLVTGASGENAERAAARCKKPVQLVRGGATRAESARNGVAAAHGVLVAVHDAARPFVSGEVIAAVLKAAARCGAAAPAVPVKDTIKQAKGGSGKTVPAGCMVEDTPDRSTLYAVQTPQCFDRAAYLAALDELDEARARLVTDDCSLFELTGRPVELVQGDYANIKITTREDLPRAENGGKKMRIGHGYDVHRLVEGRKLILGGVEVPYEKGLLGHSDADVLAHAVMDAVLGTIFYEGTPLHDGAAIIEDGRIKAAGCVLPLSNNLDLGKDMGTRHRACLGIAENSDAIAIVVSEETGIISMAKNGVLIRHFDRQTLYTRLVDEMIPKETASEKSAAEGWKARGKRLLNWVNAKEEEEQQ